MLTTKVYQHDNFIDQLLLLFLQYSLMLLRMQFFKYAVTYLLDFELSFKYFWCSVLQIFSTVSRVLMMVTVAACFMAICKMFLESSVTGLIMCYFYACLLDHFLVSIFVVLSDTPRQQMVHHFFEMERYLRLHRLCVKLLGSCFSIQGYLCKPTRTFLHI